MKALAPEAMSASKPHKNRTRLYSMSVFSAMNDENENLGAARRDERGLYFNACSTLDKYRRRRRGREEEADRRNDPSLDATLDPQADDDDDL